MQIYCLGCKRQADDMGSKKVIMTNKVISKASQCASFVVDKSKEFYSKNQIKNCKGQV